MSRMQAHGLDPDRVTFHMLLEIVGEASAHGQAADDDALHILRLMRAAGLEPDLATWSSLAAVWALPPTPDPRHEPHPPAPTPRDDPRAILQPSPPPGAPAAVLPPLSPRPRQPSPRGPHGAERPEECGGAGRRGPGSGPAGSAVRRGLVVSSEAGGAGREGADGGMEIGWAREIESMLCGLLGLVEAEARRGRTGPRDVWVLVERMRRLSMAPSRCFAKQAMEVRARAPGCPARRARRAQRVQRGRCARRAPHVARRCGAPRAAASGRTGLDAPRRGPARLCQTAPHAGLLL